MKQVDVAVLIAGAGPVGLTLGAELIRQGVEFRIVDKRPEPTSVSKASVIHVRNQELLARLGLLERVRSVGHPMRPSSVYVFGKRSGEMDFSIPRVPGPGSDTPYPDPWIIFQRDFEQLLIDHLAENGLTVERPTELTGFEQGDGVVTSTLRKPDGSEETVVSNWLIGADGANSQVRELSGIQYDGKSYDFDFEFQLGDFDLETSQLAPQEGAVFLTRQGAIVLVIPQYDGTRIVISTRRAKDASVQDFDSSDDVSHGMTRERIDLTGLEGLLRRYALSDAKLSNELWISKYRVNSRLAATFHDRRVVLVGDAAHIHVPLGGQGMNTGIGDALNLGWKLALVQQGAAPEELIGTYTAERRPVAEMVVEGTDRLFLAASKPSWKMKLLGRFLAPRILGREETKQQSRLMMSQLMVQYPFSPIVKEHRPDGHQGLSAGMRAPDAPVLAPQQGETSIFELTQRVARTSVLVFGADDLGRATGVAKAVAADGADRLAVYLISRDASPEDVPDVIPVVDASGIAHARYGATNPSLVAIRPDGYIGLISQPADPGHLESYQRRIFI